MRVLDPPGNWEELNKLLWRESIDPIPKSYRPRIAYRGMSKDFGDLRTGIQRLGDPDHRYDPTDLRFLERRLIDTFATYAIDHLPADYSDWDVLLLGQHYRLPTRLLDWTASPLMALFFVTDDKAYFDCDGIVWCVSRHDTNSLLPRRLQRCLEKQSGQLFSLQTFRKEFLEGLAAFDKCSRDAFVWFEPPSLDPRIVNQYAYFSIMPGVDSDQSEWLEKHPDICWGVPVPARLKKEIRRRLEVMNITERTVYGGLEGIARWLRGYYSGWIPKAQVQQKAKRK